MQAPDARGAAPDRGIAALLDPRGIAVLGASADAGRIGGKPVANLLRYGYRGAIHPINPRHAEVQGLRAYPAISAVPDPVDLAVLAVPAAATLPALEECAAKGVRAAIVFASGFGEMDAEGARAQAALTALARRTGMRILGPNCLGMMNIASGAICTFGQAPNFGLPSPGGMSIVSQSGAFGTFTFVAAKERGLPVRNWVSTGNEADIDFADCLAWFADDPETRVIMGYIEGCRNGPRLVAALERARAAGKPVVVMKVGRTEAGAAAAQSHTAALAGSDAVYDAILRQYGAWRATSLDEFLDIGYACLVGSRPRGPRLGIITMSGGAGVLMADAAEGTGLDVAPLPEATRATMREILPFAGVQNPVDVTGQVANDRTLLHRFGRIMLRDGGYDAVVSFHAVGGLDEATGPSIVESWGALRAEFPELPVFLSMRAHPAIRAQLEALGIPVFDEPGRMVRAVAALARLGRTTDADADADPPPGAATIPAAGPVSEAAAARVLAAAGIPMLPHAVVGSAQEAVRAADAMGYPVVLKIVSPDIAHKTDIGGVLLRRMDADAVAAGFDAITDAALARAPDARIEGIMVAPMEGGGTELILGARADPVFGPMVMLGIGGILVEVLHDVTFRRAPFGPREARRMVEELRGLPLLRGVRGGPPADLDAVVQALVRLARFAADNAGRFDSIEINPLLVRGAGQGAVGLDALIVPAPSSAQDEP